MNEDGWHWRRLLLAPHRLGFFLAMVVLAASAVWWAAVQWSRLGWLPPIGFALSPTLLHSAVMVFGFIPLFFAGFLFTAGPRWLGVEGPSAGAIAPMLLAQAAGWLLWLAGGHLSETLAITGLLLAGGGLAAVALKFLALVRASDAPDKVHAICVMAALAFGCLCLLSLPVAVLAESRAMQDGLVLGGVAQLAAAFQGEPVLPLGALHAVTMGCLGSLMLAMVTRVSCGHSGRPLVAGPFIWTLFLSLQAATVLRIAATAAGSSAQPLLAGAALLWAGVMLAWAVRHANWYGQLRLDRRPG
ncbi:MAG: NnrS family protein [Ramlibacter sp.]